MHEAGPNHPTVGASGPVGWSVLTPDRPSWRAWVFLIYGLYLLYGFGWDTVGRRLLIDVNGTVVASRDEPAARTPRYATYYIVRGRDGREQTLISGATDASLRRSMPVGTRIRKQKWRLDYERDGVREEFNTPFYAFVLLIGAALAVSGVVMLIRGRGARAAPPAT